MQYTSIGWEDLWQLMLSVRQNLEAGGEAQGAGSLGAGQGGTGGRQLMGAYMSVGSADGGGRPCTCVGGVSGRVSGGGRGV